MVMLVYHVAGTILPVLTAALLQRTAGRFGIFPGVERPHLFLGNISRHSYHVRSHSDMDFLLT
jgi:hypothetical protein